MIVTDDVRPCDAERVQEPDHRCRLGPQRPISIERGLRVAEPQEIGREAAMRWRKQRNQSAPHERRERAAVQE